MSDFDFLSRAIASATVPPVPTAEQIQADLRAVIKRLKANPVIAPPRPPVISPRSYKRATELLGRPPRDEADLCEAARLETLELQSTPEGTPNE